MKNLLTLRNTSVFASASILALTFATDLSAATPRTDQGNAALKSQVEMLMKRVNELETKEKTMGNLTEKEAATTGNNLNVKLSGQVNRAVLWHDDGSHSNFVHVDPSDEASSRLRVDATGKLSEGNRVVAVLEMDLRSNRAENTDVHYANDTNSSFSKRIVEVFFDSKRWGKVTLGHGWMAGSRVTRDTDMSATGSIMNGDAVGQLGGGTWFTTKNGPATNPAPGAIAANKAYTGGGTAVTGAVLDVKAVFNGADNHREDRLQYDTPTYWGTKLATSHSYKGSNDNWDVALKHASEVLGTKIAAQVAYFRNLSNKGGGTAVASVAGAPAKYHQWSGSAGVLFPIGLSVMFAATHRSWHLNNAPDGHVYYGKVGYQQKFFEAGLTALALDYGYYKNMILNRDANLDANIRDKFLGTTYGAYLVQHIDRVGTELYLMARTYTLCGEAKNAARYKDITMVMSGMRVKF